MNSPTYYARRYRTLYSPDALNFATRQPRTAVAAVYTPAPTGIHCGLPKAVSSAKNPRVLLTFLLPVALAAGAVTLLEGKLDSGRGLVQDGIIDQAPSAEELRRRKLVEAYGDRESLERLAEVTAIYEATSY